MAADGSQQCAAEPPVEPAEPGYRMETRAAAIVLGTRGDGFLTGTPMIGTAGSLCGAGFVILIPV